jgi:hypothetical protein
MVSVTGDDKMQIEALQKKLETGKGDTGDMQKLTYLRNKYKRDNQAANDYKNLGALGTYRKIIATRSKYGTALATNKTLFEYNHGEQAGGDFQYYLENGAGKGSRMAEWAKKGKYTNEQLQQMGFDSIQKNYGGWGSLMNQYIQSTLDPIARNQLRDQLRANPNLDVRAFLQQGYNATKTNIQADRQMSDLWDKFQGFTDDPTGYSQKRKRWKSSGNVIFGAGHNPEETASKKAKSDKFNKWASHALLLSRGGGDQKGYKQYLKSIGNTVNNKANYRTKHDLLNWDAGVANQQAQETYLQAMQAYSQGDWKKAHDYGLESQTDSGISTKFKNSAQVLRDARDAYVASGKKDVADKGKDKDKNLGASPGKPMHIEMTQKTIQAFGDYITLHGSIGKQALADLDKLARGKS